MKTTITKKSASQFKSGRVEYRIDSREVYGKIAFFPMLVRGHSIPGPYCIVGGVGGHYLGVPTYDEALAIIVKDSDGKTLREI
jgi:hypothetical protein